MSQPEPLVIDKILVPVDFEEPGMHALEYAKGLAERFGSELHLLHVVPNPFVPDAYVPIPLPSGFLDELVREARDRLDEVLSDEDSGTFRASNAVRVGDARTEILDHATGEQVDLIVMGTHGRTGAAHFFLGSVAEKIVRAAPCPVLTVR